MSNVLRDPSDEIVVEDGGIFSDSDFSVYAPMEDVIDEVVVLEETEGSVVEPILDAEDILLEVSDCSIDIEDCEGEAIIDHEPVVVSGDEDLSIGMFRNPFSGEAVVDSSKLLSSEVVVESVSSKTEAPIEEVILFDSVSSVESVTGETDYFETDKSVTDNSSSGSKFTMVEIPLNLGKGKPVEAILIDNKVDEVEAPVATNIQSKEDVVDSFISDSNSSIVVDVLGGVNALSVDTEDEVDKDLDISNFGVIDESVSESHIKVSTKELLEFLKVARIVASIGSRDLTSKSIMLKAVGDKLICKCTDFDVFVEKSIPLLNSENVLRSAVYIPTEVIVKLMKAVPVNTIIYKTEAGVFVKLYGGDMILETLEIPNNKFECSEKSFTEDGVVNSVLMYNVIKDFQSVVASAVNTIERRIFIDKSKAYATYNWALISAMGSFSEMDLKVKDINILKLLLCGIDCDLKVSRSGKGLCILECDSFKYTFLINDLKVSEKLLESLSGITCDSGVFIDYIQLSRMVEVCNDLSYTAGKIGFNYGSEGLELNIQTRKGTVNTFNLAGSFEGEVHRLDKDLVVQSRLLKVILKSFSSRSSLKISLSDDGLGIKSGIYVATISAEGY